jgi:hypothetical protein
MLHVDLLDPKKTRSLTHNYLLGSMPLMPHVMKEWTKVMKERTEKWAFFISQHAVPNDTALKMGLPSKSFSQLFSMTMNARYPILPFIEHQLGCTKDITKNMEPTLNP